ncbi:MAG: cupin domain-containing protein [Actinobacteria bacterium]|nr:MAG: cupin domain-containing protein [Actinomycetota bacterium]
MRRLNFLEDEPWDEVADQQRMRARWFGHRFDTDMLGASLTEYLPGAAGGSLHMHYGVEEMFFVLSGTLTVRTPEGEEQLTPGDVVYFPEGPDGLHTFSNPTDEPVRLLGISTKRFPDVVAYPEQGVAWVATRHPERPVPEGADEGIIARFDLPHGE